MRLRPRACFTPVHNMKIKFSQGRHGFTLVEIMIVVAIIALLASIAVPGFLRARKRSQASRIINDLRLIDGAVDMYAIENNNRPAIRSRFGLDQVSQDGDQSFPHGQGYFGHCYGAQTVDSIPRVPTSSKSALSDVTDNIFWSPYN